MPLGMTGAELAQLAIMGGSGIAGAIGQSNQNNVSAQERARQARMAALLNQQQVEQDLAQGRQQRAAGFADRMPLGSEQQYAMQQALRSALLPALAQRGVSGPTDPAVAATFQSQGNPLANVDLSRILQTVSPDATARALTDRRTALAAVDPSGAAQLRPLSDYGLDPTGEFNRETQYRTNQVQGQLDEEAATLRRLAMDQYNLSEEQAQQLEQKNGGGGFWKTLGKIGLIAGGAIATGLTAGAASPALAAAIGAGTGAASGAIDGGWKGALMGAGTGALTGGFGGGAGGAAASGVTRGTGEIIRDSLLNPQTLARMTGAGIGGPTEQAINLASIFLPNSPLMRSNHANPRMDTAQGMPQGPQIASQGGGLNIPSQSRPITNQPLSAGVQPQRPTVAPPMTRPAPRPVFGGSGVSGGGASGSWTPNQAGSQLNVERPSFMNNYGVRDDRGFVPQGAGQPKPQGQSAIPWWLMPTGMGSGALNGELVDSIPAFLQKVSPKGLQVAEDLPRLGAGGGGRLMPGGPTNVPMLPGGSTMRPQLPSGPQMTQIPQSTPSGQQVVQQLQQMLSRLPDGAARRQVMQQLMQMLGGR